MRTVSSSYSTAITSKRVHPFFMAAIEFTSGTSYFWSGIGSISWNGHTWVGLGKLCGISAIPQDSAVQANNITLSINGVPTGLIGQALAECRQNFDVSVFLGFLDDTGALIVDPSQCFAGRMDVPTISEGADTCTISITAENLLIALQRASNRRYTHADQAAAFSTDLGFNYVPSLQTWNGIWGKAGPSAAPQKYEGGLLAPYKVPVP